LIHVVFDSNVWISAISHPGTVRHLLAAVREKRFEVSISAHLLGEITRVLGGRKFGFSSDQLVLVDQEIRHLARVVHPCVTVRAVPDDPDDDRVLECAIESGAHYIVSGDRHLLKMGLYRGIRIVDPAVFAMEILKSGDDSYGTKTDETGHGGPSRVNEAGKRYRIKKYRT